MSYPHLVVARLHEHIGPIDRGERYEDPLHEVLESRSLGQVTGGGSQLQYARLVVRHGKASFEPREVRMPRWPQ